MQNRNTKPSTTSDEEENNFEEVAEEDEGEEEQEKDSFADDREIDEDIEEEDEEEDEDDDDDAGDADDADEDDEDADNLDKKNKENVGNNNNKDTLGAGVKKIPLKFLKTSTPFNSATTSHSAGSAKILAKKQDKLKRKSTAEMVMEALKSLNHRKGTSLIAIIKYVTSNWPPENHARLRMHIKRYLKTATSTGLVVQMTGVGASGSFKLGKPTAEAKQQAKEVLKKQKVAAKKATDKEKAKIAKQMQPKATAALKVNKDGKMKKQPSKVRVAAPAKPKSAAKQLDEKHYADVEEDNESMDNDDEDMFSEEEVKAKMPVQKAHKGGGSAKRTITAKRALGQIMDNVEVGAPEMKKSKATNPKATKKMAPATENAAASKKPKSSKAAGGKGAADVKSSKTDAMAKETKKPAKAKPSKKATV